MVDIIAAGHICLDLLPSMDDVPLSALTSSGMLFEIDELDISTGGAVANAGVAMHKLGNSVGLMAKVGNDLIGRVIIATLNDQDKELSSLIKVEDGAISSYTIALSPENSDRIFLHCPGANDTFGLADIDFERVKEAKLLHLGYPPLLPRMYQDGGDELAEILRRVKEIGVVTSMDTAQPDPNKPAGKVDWRSVLGKALPYVDIFVPSIEELMFMTHRDQFDSANGDVLPQLTKDRLDAMADELITMGSAIVGFKLSKYGLYLRTTSDQARLAPIVEKLGLNMDEWLGQIAYHPAYQVNVVGTTGAGDCAYSAILTGMMRGLAPQETLRLANAVAACNVQRHDATSGLLNWEETVEKVNAGWQLLDLRVPGFDS